MTSLATARILARIRRTRPVRFLVFGYLVYLTIGWILLSLPPAWEAERVSALDNLFTAASAMSTTGLATVGTGGTYSLFGEVVIVLLIQAGGLGFMTFGSVILLATRSSISSWRAGISRTAFSLPEEFDVQRFLRRVATFTFGVEAVGAALLFFAFRQSAFLSEAVGSGVAPGVASLLWLSVFHSVSAFCTAGFSLFPASLEAFRDDVWVNAVIGVLALAGAIGFIVVTDLTSSLRGRRRSMTLTSRIILWATAWVIVLTTLVLFLSESSIASMTPESRLLAALFQSVTAVSTVGFNTIPISGLALSSVLLMVVVMVIGASPAGTGGGLKSTTATAVFAGMRSALRGQPKVTFMGRVLPDHRLHAAWASLGFYVTTLMAGGFLLLLTEVGRTPGATFEALLFEASSALGTVGLSRGVTGDLSALGKLNIVVLMFLGRLGPLTFGLAFLAHRPPPEDPIEEDFVV